MNKSVDKFQRSCSKLEDKIISASKNKYKQKRGESRIRMDCSNRIFQKFRKQNKRWQKTTFKLFMTNKPPRNLTVINIATGG